jgi:hypothetical protein
MKSIGFLSFVARALSLAVLAAPGCAGSGAQVGLSNAPALGRAHVDEEHADVIANGPDSCERPGRKESDPFPNRLVACDETRESSVEKKATVR